MKQAYAQTHEGLTLASLTAEQRDRTCGYWYCVRTYGSTPHTAFRTRAALDQWLAARGLTVEGDIPPEGNHAFLTIKGTYRSALHRSYDEFYALSGSRWLAMSNGQHTLAIITLDDDGLRTVHTLNCNNRDRPTFPYRESEALIDSGNAELAQARAA